MDKRFFAFLLCMLVLVGVFAGVAIGAVAAQSDGGNATVANTTATNNTTDDSGNSGGSQWSKARVLGLVDDHVSRHSDVDVDGLERWYESNRGDFSEVEQRYVESWIQWYRTGDKPVDGLHPDLQSRGGEIVAGEPNEQNRLNGTVNPSTLEQGRKQLSNTVWVVGYEFYPSNETVVMVVESQGQQTVVYTDSYGSLQAERMQSQRIVLEDGRNYLKLEATVEEGKQLVTLRQGLDGIPLENEAPPLLKEEKNEYVWFGGGGISLGMSLMALMWFMRRDRIFQRFRPAAKLIANQVDPDSGFINRFTPGDDDPANDEYEDDIRGLLRRYASIRSLFSTALKVVLVLMILDAAGIVALPHFGIGDEAKIVIGMAIVGYTISGPFLLQPILEAVYNPALEKIQELDVQGRKNGGYWAKKGTFNSDYEIDNSEVPGDVPTREAETGQRVYLVKSIDREEQTVEPAFQWQAEQVEEIEGLDDEYVELNDGTLIGIDQVLSDARKAAIVIEDMLVEARNGKELRKAFPFVRSKIALEEAKDVAIGLNRAVSGGSVESILSDMISSYESKKEQLEEKFEREGELAGDLDDYEEQLVNQSDSTEDPDQGGGDAEE